MSTELADPKTVATTKELSQIILDGVIITKDDVRNYLCPEASDKELFMAMGIMASYKLNPFKREIHLIKYKGSPAEVIVGYESYLKRAERSGKLAGWKAGISEDKTQAWVKIWRNDWTEPFEWTVQLSEFDKKRATWTQIPTFMARKVAIAQGFRLAFPDELGGMPYTEEEHTVYDVTPETAPAAPKALEAKPAETAPAPQAPAPANGAATVIVGVKAVTPTTTKTGKTKFYINGDDGKAYCSWKEEHAEIAKNAKAQGEKVQITYTPDPKWGPQVTDLVGVGEVGA